MLFCFQILPLTLYFLVCFHLHLTLSPDESVFLVPWYEMREEQCVSPFHAVFG